MGVLVAERAVGRADLLQVAAGRLKVLEQRCLAHELVGR